MRSRKQVAKEKFLKGFNCSQTVFVAFAKDVGLKEKDILKLSTGFGAGMGRMQNTCGAVTGAFMVIGYLNGKYKEDDDELKEKTYNFIQEFTSDFKKENDTINCFELMGFDFKDKDEMEKAVEKELFKEKCLKYVLDAVDIIESKYL
jgi:C_GCAxxG_C_C family probable redox protein